MIETPRLILRPHRLEDFEASLAMNADMNVMRFIRKQPLTREDMWSRLLRFAGHWSLLGFGIFAVFEKESGEFVGELGHADFHSGLGDQIDPFPEASWVLTAGSQGKGYATEAMNAAHDWINNVHGARRTVCIIDPDNAPSLRLAEKVGYREFTRGPLRDATVIMMERVAG